MIRRCFLILSIAVLAVFPGVGAPPAVAQVIEPYGMPIPSFFFSPAERRAREACAQELPECRASIRADMEQEMAISLMLPWIMLAVAVLGVLFWLRAEEKKKLRARALARQHHEPGAFRKLDRERSDRSKDDDDSDLA